MVQPWLKGVTRRSVEKDYKFYDPPSTVWKKLNQKTWQYKTGQGFYENRDLALMSILYLTASRVSEIVRGRVKTGSLPSIKRKQFNRAGKFLAVRDIPIIKRQVETIKDYPVRNEISLPLEGDLSVFVEPILILLEDLEPEEELFKISRYRAFQIVRHITGEMNHYLREMGLKFRLRLYEKNIAILQNFSGHSDIRNLIKYLTEIAPIQPLLSYDMDVS